ncbi:MAG TPA: ABC transporter ATP-binding protein, partial [Terriglobia bacterium]|nr:ABC transporter ATP-binding protein [Terriglobia bacterium]
DNVSFRVSSGVCALLGTNGAGKSTLLKVLTGLLAPDAGEASVCGFDVLKRPIGLKRILGVMPEDLGLINSLTLKEHFQLAGPVYGLTSDETRDRSGSLLRIIGLEGAEDVLADRCSSGMRKKTALALLHNPRVLLLDEPFEGVDPVSLQTIRNLLASVARKGIVIILASHILSLVDQLASEIILIRHGRIVLHSDIRAIAVPLETAFLDLVDAPASEELPWLQWQQF